MTTQTEALRLALEALQFALHVGFPESSESQIKKGEKAYQQHRAAITAIKEALAQEQEPVAWEQFYPDIGKPKFVAQPEQEPVAWMFQHDETGRMNYVSNDGIHDPTMFLGMNPRYALVCPLYTTPPTWVELTDEEINLLAKAYSTMEGELNAPAFARAILRKARGQE